MVVSLAIVNTCYFFSGTSIIHGIVCENKATRHFDRRNVWKFCSCFVLVRFEAFEDLYKNEGYLSRVEYIFIIAEKWMIMLNQKMIQLNVETVCITNDWLFI